MVLKFRNLDQIIWQPDEASTIDVLEYVLSREEKSGYTYDYMSLVGTNFSITLRKGDIDNIIQLAVDNPKKDGVISVGKVQLEHPMIVKKVSDNGVIVPYISELPMAYQRQKHDEALFPYGVGYLIKISILKKEHKIYTTNILPYYIERWQNYEIDDYL